MKVLVGVDLNVQGHGWLLERAGRLANLLGGTVDLVFATASPTSEQQALLNGLLTLVAESHRGKARVEKGEPAEVLITLTAGYDVMVVGPREPSAIQRFLTGPMAVRVLRRSVCPVLIPRSDAPLAIHPKMLVGLDITADVDDVRAFAITWAERLQGALDGVYASPAKLPPIRNKEMREQAQRELVKAQEPERQKVQAVIDTFPEPLRGRAIIENGEPGDVLVHLSSDYDIVLVGNRGRRGLSRLLMGHVAHHVVRSAHCDVLVLPTAALHDQADQG